MGRGGTVSADDILYGQIGVCRSLPPVAATPIEMDRETVVILHILYSDQGYPAFNLDTVVGRAVNLYEETETMDAASAASVLEELVGQGLVDKVSYVTDTYQITAAGIEAMTERSERLYKRS